MISAAEPLGRMCWQINLHGSQQETSSGQSSLGVRHQQHHHEVLEREASAGQRTAWTGLYGSDETNKHQKVGLAKTESLVLDL